MTRAEARRLHRRSRLFDQSGAGDIRFYHGKAIRLEVFADLPALFLRLAAEARARRDYASARAHLSHAREERNFAWKSS